VERRREPEAAERALDEALARARRHAKSAVAEALEALRALLDAASLSTSGAPAAHNGLFESVDRWIARASRGWASEGGLSDGIAAEIAAALDEEIARWEERAKSDGDARAVLRAFLGLREVLWELGVRASFAQRAQVSRSEPKASGDHRVGERRPSGGRPESAPPEPAPRPRRIQRVVVRG
jgi:hypothetical protein